MRAAQLSFLLAIVAGPAAAAPSAPLPVAVKNGDVWTQVISHTQSRQLGSKPEQSWTLTTHAKVTYRARKGEAEHMGLEWTGAEASDGAPDLIKAAAGFLFPLDLEVDEHLTPTRIVNWAALKGAMTKVYQQSLSEAVARDAAIAMLDKLDGATATPMMLQEQTLLALGQGTNLQIGVTTQYEDQIASPLGGRPIKASGAFTLVSADRGSGRAVVRWTQDLDPESASQAAKALVDRLISTAPAAKQDEARSYLSTMTLARHDACDYQIDIRSGLAVEALCTSETRSGVKDQLGRRSDTWRMTQTLPGSQP
ncbi:hypothetical protein [Phenylobacterium aquaticum]|uniref:hypothetical protein n=1 Tax=Phenylobacterium aquaticum TaxID=1763816 RepID=UPI0026EB37F1|nr:hypothetical protein [Phenylobacterium aquaticum]